MYYNRHGFSGPNFSGYFPRLQHSEVIDHCKYMPHVLYGLISATVRAIVVRVLVDSNVEGKRLYRLFRPFAIDADERRSEVVRQTTYGDMECRYLGR